MLRALLLVFLMSWPAVAQWQILDTHSTADFRGVSSVGKGVVWISGTNGTVLRSEDAGFLWQHCTTPPGAEALDFRGIQAFDANTAIVMSSGKGDLSRLYKTTDGCQTWTLVFTDPDKDGFWDAVQMASPKLGMILGDPVRSKRPDHKPEFVTYVTEDGGQHFKRWGYPTLIADPTDAGAFSASNSSLLVSPWTDTHGWAWFGTGGRKGAVVFLGGYVSDVTEENGDTPLSDIRWEPKSCPLASGDSAGVFSIAVSGNETSGTREWIFSARLVAVGGDFKKPDMATQNATYSVDGGQHWLSPEAKPHGYRSAVAYDDAAKAWITVGPNGTDISTDDGRNWRALRPIAGDAVGADRDWNALSLPYVVGPHGRVGMLEPAALK